MRVAVLLLLRQDLLLLGFGAARKIRLLRLANDRVGSEGDTLARAMDYTHYSVFLSCALSTSILTPESPKHHHQQLGLKRSSTISPYQYFEFRNGGLQALTEVASRLSRGRNRPTGDLQCRKEICPKVVFPSKARITMTFARRLVDRHPSEDTFGRDQICPA